MKQILLKDSQKVTFALLQEKLNPIIQLGQTLILMVVKEAGEDVSLQWGISPDGTALVVKENA